MKVLEIERRYISHGHDRKENQMRFTSNYFDLGTLKENLSLWNSNLNNTKN